MTAMYTTQAKLHSDKPVPSRTGGKHSGLFFNTPTQLTIVLAT